MTLKKYDNARIIKKLENIVIDYLERTGPIKAVAMDKRQGLLLVSIILMSRGL